MSISPEQYREYFITKELLKTALEPLKEKEGDESGDETAAEEKTGLPERMVDRFIDIIARKKSGIPLNS